MIVLDVPQGSPAWHFARLGIPTASQFHRIITRATRKLAAGSETYMHELLSEWLIGIPHSVEARGFIERGNDLEPSAVAFYELQRNVSTVAVGTCFLDERRLVACSPDRLVGDDGGVEFKCPSAAKHVANLLDMTEEHYAQVQGNLWITGRAWWDLLSYHPTLPPALVRIERDQGYIDALAGAVDVFVDRLLMARAKLVDQGAVPVTALDPEFVATLEDGTTEVVP